jgi:Protein of unknown function (DUF2716)
MKAWIELNEQEYDSVWDSFYFWFNFSPSTHHFPGIVEPTPSVTYSFTYDLQLEKEIDDFYDNVLKAFQDVLSLGKRIYALDWQHTCFWFDPHKFDKTWPIGFPNGDYAIFIAEDFSFGYFGHPWEQTICVFGQPLLEAFEKYPPLLFEKAIRKNGKPVV